MTEPRLTPEDHRIWDAWARTALAHARTRAHARAVDQARAAVEAMTERCPDAYVAWSGGKDSTALTHLVRVDCGVPARAMAVKDDCDFPGEEDYIRTLASEWGVVLDVVRPPISLIAWLREHAQRLDASEDVHGRSAELSRVAFYGPIDAYAQAWGRPGVYLGLRGEESHGRRMNAATRGAVYAQRSGDTVCQPLRNWRGLDVYGYLLARGIEPLHVYRCVRLHDRPDRVRKSWWLPGAHTRHGGMVWLRAYYPTLYAQLANIFPDARRHG